ncbi:hypothetical protein [Nonomuraea maritima]|uniref:hypothetical protein n=1 Tax=Nonomuraea maritima TaxID=683260 RepID=UPI003718765D
MSDPNAALAHVEKCARSLSFSIWNIRFGFENEELISEEMYEQHMWSLPHIEGKARSVIDSIKCTSLPGDPRLKRAMALMRLLADGGFDNKSLARKYRNYRDVEADIGAFVKYLAELQPVALTSREHQQELPPSAVQEPTERPSVAIARPAAHLVRLIARLLPAQHRTRYQEELRAELYELAQAKATTLLLVLYSLQQLRRVWQLRAALQTPDRPRFFRLHRLACHILATDTRTWGVLGPLMALALVNVFQEQGWGSALYTIPGVVLFYAGVEELRKRWNVKVKRWGGSREARM